MQRLRRYILTGAPGAGKTAILRQLELDGYGVVEEAATGLIVEQQARGVAQPWLQPGFVEAVAALQRQRLERASHCTGEVQFHDRSVICTLALAQYLAIACPQPVAREAERIRCQEIYERQVFFVRNLGFVEPTAARQISFEETLRFEKIHEEAYRNCGFELFYVEAGPVADRAAAVRSRLPRPGPDRRAILQRSDE
jgi:predicted ATPase